MGGECVGIREGLGFSFFYFYDQNLVIYDNICLQTCFTNFWKGKLLKIRKQSFHMQNKFSLLFLEILTNTNTNKCCQMFLTFLKRYLKCFLFKKYNLLGSCQQQLVVVPALFERSPRVKLQTLNRLNGRRHLSSLVQLHHERILFNNLCIYRIFAVAYFPVLDNIWIYGQYQYHCYHQWTHPMLFHSRWIEWLVPWVEWLFPRYLMDLLLVAPRYLSN